VNRGKPLRRGKALKAGKPMRRGKGLEPGKPLKRNAELPRDGRGPDESREGPRMRCKGKTYSSAEEARDTLYGRRGNRVVECEPCGGWHVKLDPEHARKISAARREREPATPEQLAVRAEKRFAKAVREGAVPEFRPDLGPCLIYAGGKNSGGYGQFRYNGRGGYAHRYAWERVNGPIPDGMTIDHLCRVRACVRLGHLEVVDTVTNFLRAVAAWDCCPAGHPYTEENAAKDARRRCGICEAETRQRSEQKRRKLKPGDPDPRVRYDQDKVNEAIAQILAGELAILRAARDIGCSDRYLGRRAWRTAKRRVLLRDSGICQACGALAVDVQHRVARGLGGTRDPKRAYGMCNLVALCRPCHEIAESRDQGMYNRGFWLLSTDDPARLPIRAATEYGEELRWLLPDGGVSLADPYEEAAA